MDDIFSQAVEKIVRGQQNIIGPLALEQAGQVSGLSVDLKLHQVSFSGDKAQIIDKLVEQYKKLFGQTSVQVCRDAVHPLLSRWPEGQLPKTLA